MSNESYRRLLIRDGRLLMAGFLALTAVLLPMMADAQSFTEVEIFDPVIGGGSAFGVAWGDYDNDGDLDICISNPNGIKLLRNDQADIFTIVTEPPLYEQLDGRGVVWGDYDNDGDLDLYLARIDSEPGVTNKLFRNEGGGVFTDVTAGALADESGSFSVAWYDYDNDSDLDLYVANTGYWSDNKLLRDEGGDVFTDATTSPLVCSGNSLGVAWGDYDNDGDCDLYVSNDGSANKLLRNDGGGVFTDVTSGPLGDTGNGSGVAWGDYDNDGDLDLYLANYDGGANKLFRNDGGGAFTDVTTGPLGDTGGGASVAWGDYDNDGDLDLYVAMTGGDANKLFRNDGGGTFTDVTNGPLGDTRWTLGAAWGDYDWDGDLDLFLANAHEGNSRLLRNDLSNGNHWLHVRLIGSISNRCGIGARIRIVSGGVSQIREISAGSGYLSQNSLLAEFGLGTATVVDLVQVLWPSGKTQELTGVTVNQRISFREPCDFTISDLHSTTHTVGHCSADPVVEVCWSGTESECDVYGYSYTWTNSPDTPDCNLEVGWLITCATSPSLADGDWYFNVRAVDRVGNCSDTYSLGPFVIGPAPAGPGPCAASEEYCDKVVLTWTDNSDNEEGFTILRGPVPIATVGADVTQYEDGEGTPGVTYDYCVRAYNECGESGEACDRGGRMAPPTDPSDCVATDDSCNVVHITWSDSSAGLFAEDGFKIYRDTAHIGSVEAGITEYDDSTGDGCLEYTYYVTAFNACGESYKTGDTGTRLESPAPPTGCAATNHLTDRVTVTWEDNSSGLCGETGFRIYRNGGLVGSVAADVTTYSDFSALVNVTYEYCVTAWNDCGESLGSCDDGRRPGCPPPTGPTDCIASDESETAITVTWTDNCHPRACYEDGFNVYRDDILVGSVGPDVTIFSDRYVDQCQPHVYCVRAFTSCGESQESCDEGARMGPPAEPTACVASDNDSTKIQVTWQDNSSGICAEDGFLIYRDGVQIATVGADQTTYDDYSAGECSTYNYCVRAYNSYDSTTTSCDQGTRACYAGVANGREAPVGLALSQNWPNPFSQLTTVEFDVPVDSHIQLNIYDAGGRLIKTLTDRIWARGRHSVAWGADDEQGSPVSPGIYFIRLEAGDFTDTRKVILLQ